LDRYLDAFREKLPSDEYEGIEGRLVDALGLDEDGMQEWTVGGAHILSDVAESFFHLVGTGSLDPSMNIQVDEGVFDERSVPDLWLDADATEDDWVEFAELFTETIEEFSESAKETIGNVLAATEYGSKFYRVLSCRSSDLGDVVKAIKETGDPGKFWAYKKTGASQYKGERHDVTFRIVARIPKEDIDLALTTAVSMAWPTEFEAIFSRGDRGVIEKVKLDENYEWDDFEQVQDLLDELRGTRLDFEPYGDFKDEGEELERQGLTVNLDDNEASEIREEFPEAFGIGKGRGGTETSAGKGRGWWGESDRHSEAAKKRKNELGLLTYRQRPREDFREGSFFEVTLSEARARGLYQGEEDVEGASVVVGELRMNGSLAIQAVRVPRKNEGSLLPETASLVVRLNMMDPAEFRAWFARNIEDFGWRENRLPRSRQLRMVMQYADMLKDFAGSLKTILKFVKGLLVGERPKEAKAVTSLLRQTKGELAHIHKATADGKLTSSELREIHEDFLNLHRRVEESVKSVPELSKDARVRKQVRKLSKFAKKAEWEQFKQVGRAREREAKTTPEERAAVGYAKERASWEKTRKGRKSVCFKSVRDYYLEKGRSKEEASRIAAETCKHNRSRKNASKPKTIPFDPESIDAYFDVHEKVYKFPSDDPDPDDEQDRYPTVWELPEEVQGEVSK